MVEKFTLYGVNKILIEDWQKSTINDWDFYLTPVLEIDLLFWQGEEKSLLILTEPISIGRALACQEKLTKENEKIRKMWLWFNNQHLHREVLITERISELRKEEYPFLNFPKYYQVNEFKGNHRRSESEKEIDDLRIRAEKSWEVLRGRSLLLSEIEANYQVRLEELQWLSLHKVFTWQSGVRIKEKKFKCERCGTDINVIEHSCASCNEPCATCENCLTMGGPSKVCTPLVQIKDISSEETFAHNIADSLESTFAHNMPNIVEPIFTNNMSNIVESIFTNDMTDSIKPAFAHNMFNSLEPTFSRNSPNSLEPAFTKNLPDLKKETFLLRWRGEYTAAQKEAAEKLLNFVSTPQKRDKFLVWSVTGAGKTEITYLALTYLLEQKKRILITAPRKEVINELGKRLKEAYENLNYVIIFAGSKDKWQHSLLVLATTQQVIRFYQAFDVVIIDEIDAFPYQNDPSLPFYVKRAKKRDGKEIWLTATPPASLLELAQKKEVEVITIPARYHGYPLPVPKKIILPQLRKRVERKKIIAELNEAILKLLNDGGKIFLFVPYVADVEKVGGYLKEFFPKEKIITLSAKEEKREERIALIRANDFTIVVTTTIMERGVTFPNLHVIVLFAESAIFAESTLVQIAGRVGRSREYPDGYVYFFAEQPTLAIKKALKQIKKMNSLAEKKGYLR